MTILTWIIIAIAALVLLATVIYFAIKFFKLTPEQRKELIIQFLMGLVDNAEIMFSEGGKGAEKIAWVEEQFNKTAPWFLKLVLKLTKTASLRELIETALNKVKHIKWDKNKDQAQ